MYLINTTSLKLEFFPDERGLQYAILSHCWGPDEVLFKDMIDENRRQAIEGLSGYDKITQCCRLARQSDLDYAWVDTCCIDKSSSAELQEAINSMFRWYQGAIVCFVHLADVDEDRPSNHPSSIARSTHDKRQFRDSRWFRRGWTLQELLAPDLVIFFTASWTKVDTRNKLADIISNITGINTAILQRRYDPDDQRNTAEIMSWACGRKTTRVEDRAYSLLGLFNINMPMLYGEGDKAFKRLQEEIMRSTSDHSIFAWSGLELGHRGLFAPSPDNFAPKSKPSPDRPNRVLESRRQPDTLTNQGISLHVNLIAWRPFVYVVIVNRFSRAIDQHPLSSYEESYLGIYLRAINNQDCYIRVSFENTDLIEIETSRFIDHADNYRPNVIQNHLIHVVYRLTDHEHIVADTPMFPYQFKVHQTSSSPEISNHGIGWHDDTACSCKGEMISVGDMGSGTVYEIDIPTYPGSTEPNHMHRRGVIELGFDARFRPYCIIVYGTEVPELYEWRRKLGQQTDELTWQNSLDEASQSLVTVKNLHTPTSEYAFLPKSQGCLIVRMRRSMYDMQYLTGQYNYLFSVGIQLETDNSLLTCQVTTTMSAFSGWEFWVDISKPG